MSLFNRKNKKRNTSYVGVLNSDLATIPGYTRLSECPEIVNGCRKIAETLGGMTLHLIANTAQGDKRVINELSRKLDITPNKNMTRKPFIEAVIMNLLLYGDGNSVIIPKTSGGLLESLDIARPALTSFEEKPDGGYIVIYNGIRYQSDEVIHIRLNPDPYYTWKGQGITLTAKQTADSLKRAGIMTNDYLTKQYKPSLIVKIDASDEGFTSPEGRRKILNEYFESSKAGEPWLLPMEQFEVQDFKPLTLQDLAISDQVKDLRKFAAAVLGVPEFLLGVGSYNKDEWNNFINSTIRNLALTIQQELTAKLITSPKMYCRFNIWSLLDYSLPDIANTYGKFYDQGIVTGNEVRDRLGLEPRPELDEPRILENYIPLDKSGEQKKLN